MSDNLVHRSRTIYIARDQKPQGIWPPVELWNSNGLSLLGKVRLLGISLPLALNWQNLDIARLGKAAPFDHQTATEFWKSHLGSEAADYFINPLIRGLLYWDPDTTSAAVVLCILKSLGMSKGTYRMSSGMRELTVALGNNSSIFCQSEVVNVSRLPDRRFRVTFRDGKEEAELISTYLVCATPAPATASILPWLPSSATSFLESITYSQTTVLTFAVPARTQGYPQGAILFPTSTVADLSSVNPLYKYVDLPASHPELAKSQRLLNVYLSNEGACAAEQLSDDALGQEVLRRVNALLNSPGWIPEASLKNVQRWPQAIPRFNVGHIEKIEAFNDAARDVRGIAFAGDYLMGPYIDGAVRSGLRAASTISKQLT